MLKENLSKRINISLTISDKSEEYLKTRFEALPMEAQKLFKNDLMKYCAWSKYQWSYKISGRTPLTPLETIQVDNVFRDSIKRYEDANK